MWKRIRDVFGWVCMIYLFVKMNFFPDNTPRDQLSANYSHGSLLTDAGHPWFLYARPVATALIIALAVTAIRKHFKK